MKTESRAWLTELEIRSGGDGRIVHGLAAPFNRPTAISDGRGRYTETIRPNAFSRTLRERGHRVRFRVEHDDKVLPIGRATKLVEDSAGLVADLRVSNTRDGDEALELIHDGVLDGLSIGFHVMPNGELWSPDRSERELVEVRLDEISAVTEAAYANARVLAVRNASPDLSVARARLELLQKETPR